MSLKKKRKEKVRPQCECHHSVRNDTFCWRTDNEGESSKTRRLDKKKLHDTLPSNLKGDLVWSVWRLQKSVMGKCWSLCHKSARGFPPPVSIRLRVSIYGFNIQMKCFNNLNLDACIFGDSGESSVKLSAAGSRTRRWQGIDPQVLLLKPLESWAKVRPSISAAQMRRYTIPPSSFRLSVCLSLSSSVLFFFASTVCSCGESIRVLWICKVLISHP